MSDIEATRLLDAAKQALEALEALYLTCDWHTDDGFEASQKASKTIDYLRQAIALEENLVAEAEAESLQQEPAIDPCKEGTCDCCWKHLDEQEPMACGLCGEKKAFAGACGGGRDDPRALCYTHPQADQASMTNAWFKKCCELQDELKALQEQEGHGLTIAYMSGFQDGKKAGRKERSDRWIGLTPEEVRQICGSVPAMKDAVREAEAKLKEKNT